MTSQMKSNNVIVWCYHHSVQQEKKGFQEYSMEYISYISYVVKPETAPSQCGC